MSLTLVTETDREIRRLAQAGSDLARGDFRLERLREPLQAAGAKVPVFAKLAEAVGALTTAAPADAADRLLTVATLAQAILATQAEPGVGAGELRPLTTITAPGRTVAPYRQLEPVLTALSTTGPGRLEVVKLGFDQGHFNDLRLTATAVRGLGDPAADIGTFLHDTVLPAYGPAILPLLREGLDLQGSKAHARRLELIARFAGPAENALYREAADTGSKEVKVAAVAALGNDPDATPRLREMAKKGPRDVRVAALGALGKLGDAADIPLLLAALRGANGEELALHAVWANRSPAMTAALVAAGRADLQTLLVTAGRADLRTLVATPVEGAEEAANAFVTLLHAVGQRPDPEEVTTFLGECLEQTPTLARYDTRLPHGKFPALVPVQVSRALLAVGTSRALKMLAATRGRFDEILLGPAMRAAVACQSSAEVFDGFGPYLTAGKSNEREAVLEELRQLVTFQPAFRLRTGTNLPHQGNRTYQNARLPGRGETKNEVAWDPRWRAKLMERDGWNAGKLGALKRALFKSKPGGEERNFAVHEIVAALTTPGDPEALAYLEAQLGNLPSASRGGRGSAVTWYGEALVLLGLVQGGHPRAAELLVESARRLLAITYGSYRATTLRDVATKLPPDQQETFLRLARELPEGDVRESLLTPARTETVS